MGGGFKADERTRFWLVEDLAEDEDFEAFEADVEGGPVEFSMFVEDPEEEFLEAAAGEPAAPGGPAAAGESVGKPLTLADPVSLALIARLGAQVPADVTDVELVEGLGAAQRVVGFMTSRMYGQVAELYARRVGPASQAVAAARVAGDAQAVRRAVQTEDLEAGAVVDEVLVELSWSRMRAQRFVEIALTLQTRMPRTLDGLAGGGLEVKKAEVLATDIGGALADDDLVARVEAVVLPVAAGLNVPMLRERIKLVILTLAPELAAERAAKAKRGTGVRYQSEPDDMMVIEARMTADLGVRLVTALDRGAEAVRTPEDTRSVGQRRVDILVEATEQAAEALIEAAEDELGESVAEEIAEADTRTDTETDASAGERRSHCGPAGSADPDRGVSLSRREHARRRVRIRRALKHEVNVTVPLETITGDADLPGYLARYGPVTADLARRMAADAAVSGWWRCAVTDDTHGTLLGLGKSMHTPAYRAGIGLQRFLNLRSSVCDFPGCNQAAASCEFDHDLPYPVGATCECNGRKRCKRHHRIKHETRWQVHESTDPADPPGTSVWRTPTGRRHKNAPRVIGVPQPRTTDPVSGCDTVNAAGPANRDSAVRDGWAYDPAAGLPELNVPEVDLNPPPF